MKFIDKPLMFHLAQTKLDILGTHDYLTAIGAEGWQPNNTGSEGETLMEICGKSCYRSFNMDVNANLSAVRDDNKAFLGNIISSGHGAVLEHVYDTFAFVGVSRVFTHELVRHRIANYSQESLRFVRLSDLSAWFPGAFGNDFLAQVDRHLQEKGKPGLKIGEHHLRERMLHVFEYLEDVQLELANDLKLDDLESFALKKKLTSACRRLAPIGLATVIIATTNIRSWRHIISMRTSRHAEEEIRIVFGEVAKKLMADYPNAFQDASLKNVDGILEVTFDNPKV